MQKLCTSLSIPATSSEDVQIINLHVSIFFSIELDARTILVLMGRHNVKNICKLSQISGSKME